MDAGVEILPDDLTDPAVLRLLNEHVRALRGISPPESCHVLDPAALRQPGVAFWTAWRVGELAGCAALKQIDATHGEIKSMRTARAHLRQGIAAALLRHLLDEAQRRGYRRVSLETGSMDEFAPAQRLYASFGFVPCAPFGDYVDDPNSLFLTRALP